MFNKKYIFTSDHSVIDLGNQDPTLQKLINTIGDIEVETRPNFFESLIRSIIGQQISVQAADSIFQRLVKLTNNELKAETLANMTTQELRSAGLSSPKINYIHDLTQHITTGKLNLVSLSQFDNQTVLKELTKVKGIGKWTAEMFLIFSLGRMDVLAIDDIGLQRGAKWLYQVEQSKRKDILIKKKPIWQPHLTLASFYLWEAVLTGLISNFESIDDIK